MHLVEGDYHVSSNNTLGLTATECAVMRVLSREAVSIDDCSRILSTDLVTVNYLFRSAARKLSNTLPGRVSNPTHDRRIWLRWGDLLAESSQYRVRPANRLPALFLPTPKEPSDERSPSQIPSARPQRPSSRR